MNVIQDIRRTLHLQANTVKTVAASIDGAYKRAVDEIYRCKGKLIITGIGKSGVIAQKIASTFASTGTPAIYLHPAEALHGNLGVVNKKDIVLAIGKSGESEEVLALLPSIKRIGARVICITANKNSSLARQSKIVLYTPINKEACPLNLAPTTSSTVALVVGDALAITLMKKRGFGAEHFALFHPGGLLGKKLLLRVEDVMRAGRRNPVVKIDASIEKLLGEISRKWTGAASIVDRRGKFVGLVTDFDIRRAIKDKTPILGRKIKEIMNARPTFIYSDEMAIKASEIMEFRQKPLTVLPVLDRKRRAVGMIHLHDLVTRGLVQDPTDRS